MEKIILGIARVFFVAVVMIVGVGAVCLLAMGISQDLKSETVMALTENGGERVAVAGYVNQEERKMVTEAEAIGADSRGEIIRRYLEKYKSPLLPYSDLIMDLSNQYGFEYYWIIAIGQQESNLCKKIPEDSHNCWGYGIHSQGTLKFESYELALKSYAEYLKRVYFDKGLNTPELIMKKYCPNSPDGAWAKAVGHIIEDIESGNF